MDLVKYRFGGKGFRPLVPPLPGGRFWACKNQHFWVLTPLNGKNVVRHSCPMCGSGNVWFVPREY